MPLPQKDLLTRAGLRALALCWALAVGPAAAGEPETLYLKGGDRLSGFNRGIDEDSVSWELPYGQVLSIPLSSIERIEYPVSAGLNGQTNSEDGPDRAETPLSESNWFYDGAMRLVDSALERYDSYRDFALQEAEQWTRRVELGGRLRDGNTEEDYVNVRGRFERSDENRMLSFDLGGRYGFVNGRPSENRWYGNSTLDISRKGSWILFLTNKNEFDEFENLDYRGTLAGGLGYRFFNEKQRRLIFRLGPGVTFERFHGPRLYRTTPDLLGEAEFRWPLMDRTQFEHKSTINPSAGDFEIFRIVSNYGLLMRLDEGKRWSLKFDVRHEYNSKPNKGRRHSDYTTSVLLLYERK